MVGVPLLGTPADQLNVRLQWASSATTVNENAGTVTLQAEMVTTENGHPAERVLP